MTRTIALVCALLMASCGVVQRTAQRMNPPTIDSFEAGCRNTAFPAYGGCIRTHLEQGYPRWRSDRHADLVDVYLAWLDAAGTRVAAGRMEESEARLGAAEMKVRLKSIASERATNTAIQQQAGISQMLAGLALIDASQPHPAANAPIICTTSEAVRGNLTTICH